MGMVSVADAEILLATVTSRYMDQFRNLQTQAWAPGLLHTLPMTKSKTRLPWLKVFSGFREWNNQDKYWNGVQVDDFAAETKPLETSFKIDRRNSLPQILETIVDLTDGLAEAVAFFDDDLTARALLDGQTGGASYKGYKFYDGLAAFSASHPIDLNGDVPGTWPNLFLNSPLSLESIEAGIHAMARVQAPNGRNMRVFPTHLLVPSTLSQTAKRLADPMAKMIGRLLKDSANAAAASSETNIHAGQFDPIVAPELTSGFPREGIVGEPNNWYLLCKTSSRKPLTKLSMQEPQDMPLNGQIDGKIPDIHYGKEASASVIISQPWFIAKFRA